MPATISITQGWVLFVTEKLKGGLGKPVDFRHCVSDKFISYFYSSNPVLR